MLGRFEVGGREYTIVEWHEVRPDEERVEPSSALALLRHLLGDELTHFELRRTLADAGLDLTHVEPGELLSHALSTGRLAVRAEAPRAAHEFAPPAGEPVEAEVEPAPAAEHDWIEIELADEDGVPVLGAELELTMPDGSVRRARTDERGRFSVPRTDSGQCKLRWTKLHPVERASKFASASAGA